MILPTLGNPTLITENVDSPQFTDRNIDSYSLPNEKLKEGIYLCVMDIENPKYPNDYYYMANTPNACWEVWEK